MQIYDKEGQQIYENYKNNGINRKQLKMIEINFQLIRCNILDQSKKQRKYLKLKEYQIQISQKQTQISVSQRFHLINKRIFQISYLILRKFLIIWSIMIMDNKNIQFIKNSQLNRFTNKIQMTPYQSLKLKSTANKFAQTKKCSLNKNNKNFTTLKNPKKMKSQPQFTQSKFFNHFIQVQKQNKKQQNQKDLKRQTFKDFIRKIESYNQNYSTNQNHQNFLQGQPSDHNSEYEDQLKINNPFEVNLKGHFRSDKKQKQTTIFETEKLQNQYTKQKPRKFFIHDKMNKSLHFREYCRSKTEQINIKNIDLSQNKIPQEAHLIKNFSIDNMMLNKTIAKLNSQKNSNNQLKLVNIRLSQKLNEQLTSKQFLQSNFSLQSSLKHLETSQVYRKKNQNQKKNSQFKHSKIRIRLGSSLCSKNISTLQSFNSNSKNHFKKDPQNIFTDSGKIHIQRKLKTSLNSQLCQNKITQAQKIFIQKRRLLPTAQIKSRQNMVRTKRQFFTVSNSFDKYRRRKNQIERESVQCQNLEGWQSKQQGVTHFKIEQLF